jgi:two-component system, NtrC family, sensor kinase
MNNGTLRHTFVSAPWAQLLTRTFIRSHAWVLVAGLIIATAIHLIGGDSWWSVAGYTLVIAAAVQYTIARAVRTADASCRSLIEASMDIVMILDRDGRLLAMNHVGEEQIWHSSRELIGRPFEELLLVADREAWAELFAGARSGKRGAFTLRFLRGDSAQRWMSGTVAPVSANGRVRRIVAMARDITDTMSAAEEHEKMRTQLAHAQKMQAVGQLVSGVAHQLSNPLTAVMSCAEEMLLDPRTPSDTEDLTTILAQARRCRTIVQDLLSFAIRKEDAVVPPSFVAPIVERVIRAMQPKVTRAGVSVTTRIDPRIPCVAMDASAVEQVVETLLTNALQAAGTSGRVTVSARAGEDGAELTVEDSGPGIEPDVLPRIFEPFFTTKSASEAKGLGLSLALGVVKQAGGTLRVSNRGAGPRAGAMFVATIPFAGDASGDRPKRRTEGAFADLGNVLSDRPAERTLSIEAEVTRRTSGKPYVLPHSRPETDSMSDGGEHA